MSDFKLIYNYKENEKYVKSYMLLAKQVFGIDFEGWYSKGYWTDKYYNYSFTDGDKMIANISMSKMEVVIDGEVKKALQLGAVMTHQEYRNRGFSAKLMDIVLREEEKRYDFIYLFANSSVLNFYPKFGFQPVEQTAFSVKVTAQKKEYLPLSKLDMSNKQDMDVILRLSADRRPVSRILGVQNDQTLLMFYFLNVFSNDIYYLKEEDTILIYQVEEDILHLYDILSCTCISLLQILNRIVYDGIKEVVFHFTPEMPDIDMIYGQQDPEDNLFIKATSLKLPERFIFPELSHG